MGRYLLQQSLAGLRLVDSFSHQHPLLIDFGDAGFSYRLRKGGGKAEHVARAIGAKKDLKVLDCTAGLGRDAVLLASLGCQVTMLERSNVLAMLLRDALERASHDPDLAGIVSRLTLLRDDSIRYLTHGNPQFDAILIDPMFPSRRKTAQVKGEMQFLQRFIGKDQDVSQLISAAQATGCRRIVVKRPLESASTNDYPAGKPSHSVKGKSSQFDVYLSSL